MSFLSFYIIAAGVILALFIGTAALPPHLAHVCRVLAGVLMLCLTAFAYLAASLDKKKRDAQKAASLQAAQESQAVTSPATASSGSPADAITNGNAPAWHREPDEANAETHTDAVCYNFQVTTFAPQRVPALNRGASLEITEQ